MADYYQLRQVEDDTSSENEKSQPSGRFFQGRNFGKLLIVFHIILFASYLSSILYLLNRQPSDQACDSKHSTYSPALPKITYSQPHHLSGEIAQTNKYRGPPSPEIDAAWLSIGLDTPAMRLYDSDLKRLNKSDTPDRPLHRIPEEFGGGYLGMLEVFHLLHCLDSVRRAMNREYYAAGQSEEGTRADRVHDQHCIDILRVHIQCTGDVTPITFYNNVLNPARTLPMPDFNTLHTCRNFDDILEWNANNERTIQWDEIGLDLSDVMHVD